MHKEFARIEAMRYRGAVDAENETSQASSGVRNEEGLSLSSAD